MEAEFALVAARLGAAVLPQIIEEIAKALNGGKTEEEATREALEKLAALPDLEAILPVVKGRIAAARRSKSERG